MWKMVTSQGDLSAEIKTGHASLVKRIDDFFNPEIDSKNVLRDPHKSAIRNLLSYLKMDKGVGSAFPPFHARYLCDHFLPKNQSHYLVIDPCAGWGGRLLGTLAVPREGTVKYIGIDPEQRNSVAYEALVRRINIWLKKEIHGPREAKFFYAPFEDWIDSTDAKRVCGKADLVMTSPPYFGAELYNPGNPSQSFNRYPAYTDWVEHFYRPLVKGAYDLLKPGGVFVLNIAKIKQKTKMKGGEQLEVDARRLARNIGFENAGFFKLAMSKTPGTKKAIDEPKRGKSVHVLSVNGITWKYEPVFCFRKPITEPVSSRKATNQGMLKTASKAKVSVASWQDIRTLYKPYDKTCNDSFKRIKQNDSPLVLLSDDKPVAGLVVNQRKTSGSECLYKGKKRSVPCLQYERGDTEVSKFSIFDTSKSARKSIVNHLKSLPRPCIVEVNSICIDEIEALCDAGFAFGESSVNSMGDVYHLYIDEEHVEKRRLPIHDAERINVERLANFDFTSLAQAIESKIGKISVEFTNHASHYNIKDTWGAIALRGYLPDPAYIESIEETSAYQRRLNNEVLAYYKPNEIGLQNTHLLAKFPEVQKILDAIVPGSSKSGNASFKRVRFMRLLPKDGELERHTDLTDQSLGIEDGKTVRLHVPIKTNAKVKVTSWSLMNEPTVKHFNQGELWYLNIRLPHKVINAGDEERIHLVIDVIADERLRSEIAGGGQRAKPHSVKPKQNTSGALKTVMDYLSLIGDWSDPNPPPVIEKHDDFLVVRDDLLEHGSKIRFIDFMVRTASEDEFVFGGSNKVGWGAISLAAVCKRYNKNATFFMAATSNSTWHQNEVKRLGGRIEWVANGMLNDTLARARAYSEAAPTRRRLLPIGLEDDTVIASIIKVAQGLGVRPKEVWTVASSGTLTRGLQIAFPSAKFFAVQTGHSLTEQTAGRAEVHVSPYRYDKPVRAEEAPPYPSEPFYDAKLWTFAVEKGRKGALIWNVAGNQARMANSDKC
jgi:tRNA1(Val) A37 N6-methylase TrmN6